MRKLALFSLVLLTLTACMDAQEKSDTPLTKVKYEAIEIEESGGKCSSPTSEHCAVIKLNYPEITEAQNQAMRDRLNLFIQELLLDHTLNGRYPKTPQESASNFIAEYVRNKDIGMPWTWEQNIVVLHNENSILSLSEDEYGFTGGAHGSSNRALFSIDLQSGKQLILDDLFIDSYEADLNTIGESIFRQLKELTPEMDLEEAGFWFDNNTFTLNNNFAVTAQGIVFYFNAYEIAPYAAGPTELTIPWTELEGLIKPSSPLSSLAPAPKATSSQ